MKATLMNTQISLRARGLNWLRWLVGAYRRESVFALWCIHAIPGAMIAAAAMWGWAHVVGDDPFMEATAAASGILIAFPIIGLYHRALLR